MEPSAESEFSPVHMHKLSHLSATYLFMYLFVFFVYITGLHTFTRQDCFVSLARYENPNKRSIQAKNMFNKDVMHSVVKYSRSLLFYKAQSPHMDSFFCCWVCLKLYNIILIFWVLDIREICCPVVKCHSHLCTPRLLSWRTVCQSFVWTCG